MIERIAQRMWNGLSPRFELREMIRLAGNKVLRNSVSAHRTPLVVIAFEPNFEKVFKLPIVRKVLRRKVAMIIEDGLFLGELMIQPLRSFGLEKEIFVNEV